MLHSKQGNSISQTFLLYCYLSNIHFFHPHMFFWTQLIQGIWFFGAASGFKFEKKAPRRHLNMLWTFECPRWYQRILAKSFPWTSMLEVMLILITNWWPIFRTSLKVYFCILYLLYFVHNLATKMTRKKNQWSYSV